VSNFVLLAGAAAENARGLLHLLDQSRVPADTMATRNSDFRPINLVVVDDDSGRHIALYLTDISGSRHTGAV